MSTSQRTISTVGLLLMCIPPGAALASPSPQPARSRALTPRPSQPRMSGPKDRPVQADSRFPGEAPRPNGALLGPLPSPALRLESEALRIRCRFGGGGCAVRHDFVVRNAGDATTLALRVISPRMAPLAEVDGIPVQVRTGPSPPRRRRLVATGLGVDPSTGDSYELPGSRPWRRLRVHLVLVRLPARGRVTITLITNSVGGYDRFRRARTQPEVSFVGTRRRDHFVHHHELLLVDPWARRPRRGSKIEVTITLPTGLELGSNTGLACKSERGPRALQRCSGRVSSGLKVLRWSMAERRRRPWGLFVGVGLAFTHRGGEPLLRAGASIMLRRRKDLVSLSAETDARERFGLALSYQLFLPYAPHSAEMGGHFELGLEVDLVPHVRPAIRLGAALHISMVRVGLLLDVYPGEMKKGGGPSWRGQLTAGVGF